MMTLDELKAGLIAKKAAIVHFSHFANMRPGGVYPEDLKAAIARKDEWTLSCSVVWPSHNMAPCGDVGVIFWPNDKRNVLSVSGEDSGSSQFGKEEISGGVPLTAQSFEDTFSVASRQYNEWRVCGADVKGIFVSKPHNIQAKMHQTLTNPLSGYFMNEIYLVTVSLDQIKADFSTYEVFTMTANGLKIV